MCTSQYKWRMKLCVMSDMEMTRTLTRFFFSYFRATDTTSFGNIYLIFDSIFFHKSAFLVITEHKTKRIFAAYLLAILNKIKYYSVITREFITEKLECLFFEKRSKKDKLFFWWNSYSHAKNFLYPFYMNKKERE